jgi:predicted TIM-barrel fold metal-dependent hydrolase
MFERLAAIAEMSSQKDAIGIFKSLKGYYPRNTKFILLSIDTEFMELGEVPQSFEKQLDELEEIKNHQEFGDLVYPFICADPRRTGVVDLIKEKIESGLFSGIKIYPPFGYFPDDEGLDGIYEYAVEKNVPVLGHCTPDGFKSPNYKIGDNVCADPDNYKKALEKFPTLKLCLAHFGGITEWEKYLFEPWSEEEESSEFYNQKIRRSPKKWKPHHKAWVSKIIQMIKQKNDDGTAAYPNLYADISYTAHNPRVHAFLKVLLEDDVLKKRILFGSDYYVVHTKTSERDFSISLRGYLGDAKFDRIARKNPSKYLSP